MLRIQRIFPVLHRLTTPLLLCSMLVPCPALAQQLKATSPAIEVDVGVATAARRNALADTLDARAVALYGSPREWRAAARLHERAATLRGVDSRSYQSYRAAAWAYSAASDQGAARDMMEHAAESATACGDVERAANSFIDAALLATADHRDDLVPLLLGRARTVLASPLLPEDRRAAILRRIGEGTRVAGP